MGKDQLTRTPRLERALEQAEREARQFGHDYVGTEHVLLALLADDHGIAAQALSRVGAANDLRSTITGILSSAEYATSSEDPQPE